MQSFERFNWAESSPDEQLEMLRKASPRQLRSLARRYDWKTYPETVLSWIMSQRCIDLGTAVTVFFNGEPERFNYIPKRDLPKGFHRTVRVLDNILLRMNSGYYRSQVTKPLPIDDRLDWWMDNQAQDARERRRGRWEIEKSVLVQLETQSGMVVTECERDEPEQANLHSALRRSANPVRAFKQRMNMAARAS
ncbi:hypothetical protein ROA7450_00038 [Roseovarius albus]|uniref:DUF4274 domain-containing protein n=1 Tax=Roseovarius albus TaxID=1247867 RepID=A0A1X6Y536_9RHOB|nr:hypothetical protein [Roseovarius albus]SLN10818.1 hypothetical protein ROA7450_00038 [Roseovarius albus]